ncbi:MAG: hypothetical protein KGL39_43410 [Patescibacteria group bacterium]|nr:hypothetical protein [Patescibacteria group bacterium]
MTDEAALNIRHMDRNARDRLSRGARARGMTLAQYVEALVDLHHGSMAIAHDNNSAIRELLLSLGLESVTA